MALSEGEVERYARHLVLREVGGPGQNMLKAAKVLVVGAGGLGAPILLYLAAAGIGTIGIVDHDTVGLSNLQRQVVHTTSMVGQSKTLSAARMLCELNPNVRVVEHPYRIDVDNAMDLVSQYDLVCRLLLEKKKENNS